ncbi:ATP-dependent DNA ligase [Alteromonas sp. KC3]|uniref:DNA ligase n=1 Tax=unclassified Alteromonas TaxID=2614992 RepID=UPI0019225F14|nr:MULTISPECIES: DNA ligase [unclassified Alteromonas]BCO17804.1 ATP-dependent DNA ligase [Alteromonas sp. KC3]BCO21765.1 ATP-dependent DNA ligase [Alteromonas sp. KC14]
MNRVGYSAYVFSMLVASPLHAAADITPLQLATPYDIEQDTITIENYWVSEKLDGIRARWTGSQLLTRSGTLIHTPHWFTKDWPNVALDGELWIERGQFEKTASVVLSYTPDTRWHHVAFMAFDLPQSDLPFEARLKVLRRLIGDAKNVSLTLVEQYNLTSLHELEKTLDKVLAHSGEGLMLHHKNALYLNGRSEYLLKLKKFDDDEAKVISHVKGKGKYTDVLGALLVQTREGVIFKLGSGFSDKERENPPPVNSWVTFKYAGKTRNGKPRFASFLRQRPNADISH